MGVELGEAQGAAGTLGRHELGGHWRERRPPGAIFVGRRCGALRRVMAAAAVRLETSPTPPHPLLTEPIGLARP
jgi:hypothetical protein